MGTISKTSNRWKLAYRFPVGLTMIAGLLACGEDSINQNLSKHDSLSPRTEGFAPPTPAIVTSKDYPVTPETREIYKWYCAQCHGLKGEGDGINSKHVTVPPRNHTKASYLETRSDQELFDAIRLGGLKIGRAPCMPAWGHTLKESIIWELVNYIRELCHCEAI